MRNRAVWTVSAAAAAAVVVCTCVASAEEQQCSVYMAKASLDEAIIPVSIYAGVDFAANVTIGNPELGIHLTDLQLNVNGIEGPPFNSMILDFLWTPSEIVSQFEDNSGDHGMALLSGMGFAGSTSPGIFNARWNHSAVLNRYRTTTPRATSLDWRMDPMTCAVSDFFNVQMQTTTAIKAGSEIFPFFGDSWLESKEESLNNDPEAFSKKNFDKAEEVISQYAALLEKHKEFFSEGQRAQDYWDLIVNDVIQDDKVRKLLPTLATQVPEMAGKPLLASKHPNIEQSMNYLMSHGTCMDNLVQGTSTIPGAGRGAFAKRAISKGDIVAAAPLIRFFRNQFTVFAINAETKERTDEVEGEQLLLNYALGHPKSPLVFYPYGTGINLINHATHGSKFVPNVKFVWSNKDYHDSQYLQNDVNTLEKEQVSPFVHVMDIVATRDISEGEEILLDYGVSFDEALKTFVEDYQKSIPQFSSGDISANVLNAINEPFRTMQEQKSSPYPVDIDIMCYYDHSASIPAPEGTTLPNFKQLLEMEESDSILPLSYVASTDAVETNCDILQMNVLEGNEPTYVVRVPVSTAGNYAYVVDLPHSAMIFVDKPYSSPAQGAGSFRHYIEIPEDVFPKAWIIDT